MDIKTKTLSPITSRDVELLQHADQNIARRGTVAKRCSDPNIPIHPGMTRQQQDMAGVGGLGHGVSIKQVPDAGSGNPLDPTTPPKNLTPVTIKPGMRSRVEPTNDDAHRELGARVLAEAAQKVPR
jgi:hypothetical protein